MMKLYRVVASVVLATSLCVAAASAAELTPVQPGTGPQAGGIGFSDREREILSRGEISTASYVTGGVLGTVLGLGIGQAVQGRWYETGWIATAGEVGSLGLMLAGGTSCSTTMTGSTYSSTCSTSSTTVLGVVAFVGFRIFELIDVWAGPPSHNDRYQRIRERAEGKKVSWAVSPGIVSPEGRLLPGAGLRIEF